jgi:hypothetical protein
MKKIKRKEKRKVKAKMIFLERKMSLLIKRKKLIEKIKWI